MRPLKHFGARRLAIKARLAGWNVHAIARWLDQDTKRVRRWLQECGRTIQGRHGHYVFDVAHGTRLELTFDELLATGAWPEDGGLWRGRARDDGDPLPDRDWLLAPLRST